MLNSRAALYFDEVARQGSIRKAAERLRIAASAIDRQLLQLETYVGAPLFERTTQGMRLTAAGELLVATVRRSRRDMDRVRSHIDDLQGMRRGRISVATVEGAISLLGKVLKSFREQYPAIEFRIFQVTGQKVVDLVLDDECDFGLTVSPRMNQNIRIEAHAAYRIGLVVRTSDPIAALSEIDLGACAEMPMIFPDDSLSLRSITDQIWLRRFGELPYDLVETSTIAAIKSLVKLGVGSALLTPLDVMGQDDLRDLAYVPLKEDRIPLSVLSLVSRSARSLSVPASLMMNSIAAEMADHKIE